MRIEGVFPKKIEESNFLYFFFGFIAFSMLNGMA